MANDIFNGGNCGVVGCWGTDAQGRKTLNGKLNSLDTLYIS